MKKHALYESMIDIWKFYAASYTGGNQYQAGQYLGRYLNEEENHFNRRVGFTPIDNHCANVVHIYSSYLWKDKPIRNFNAMTNDPIIMAMVEDIDLDNQTIDDFMREVQIWSSVYGHVWVIVDKPQSTAGTRADELASNIRPYFNLYTPENVIDWNDERNDAGIVELTMIKVYEGDDRYRVWTKDQIALYEAQDDDTEKLIEVIDNPLGEIPAVFVPTARTTTKGIGRSDITDISLMQKAIYNELSEVEQIIRITNHPTLVKTTDTNASAGAGGVVVMPDDLDPNLKPYQMQPSGASITAVMESMRSKVEAISRMAHLGAARGTDAVKASGVALQTEFQLLNAKLSEKADLLETAETQLWEFVAQWQDKTPDIEISYPDNFDIRDTQADLEFYQQAKASGVQSPTLMKEIDKRIADLVLDDELLEQAYKEIDENTRVTGVF